MTIEIELLDNPNLMVPNDIVVEQGRPYRFLIRAGEEWHAFNAGRLGMNYEIPPGGEVDVVMQFEETGVFDIEDWRRLPHSPLYQTITVVPQGMSASSWHPACVAFRVDSPPLGAGLTAPFVIQGSFQQPAEGYLRVTRIEAWTNGEQVGVANSESFTPGRESTTFYLTVSELPQNTNSIFLRTLLQNGAIVASAVLPLTPLADSSTGSFLGGYQGSIDLPVENQPLILPVTIQGWAAIPGTGGGTGVGSIEIWNGPRETGQFLTEAVYGTYRPDVAEELGEPRFTSSGFFAQLTDLPIGSVDLHVYVRDRESGAYASPRMRQPQLVRRIAMVEGKVIDAAWPVALAAAPDGRLFYAELLTGNIRVVKDGELLARPFATIDGVSTHAESGLTGLALHGDFPQEPFVYAMYVVDNPRTGLPSGQRVVRFRAEGDVGRDGRVILDSLPATTVTTHNGGRLAFGPDGKLYVSIGDTNVPEHSQDLSRLEGAILRYNPDGSIPDDNPVPGSPVFAKGLRNVFGMAFQPGSGRLFATDNGPGGFDEVNIVVAGGNYGWPGHMGVVGEEGFADPIAVYGNWPERPIGPTGATFVDDRPDILLFCAYHDFFLRAVHLAGPDHTTVADTTVLSRNCALDVTYSNDGWLYYSSIFAIYRAKLDDLLRLHEQRSPE